MQKLFSNFNLSKFLRNFFYSVLSKISANEFFFQSSTTIINLNAKENKKFQQT